MAPAHKESTGQSCYAPTASFLSWIPCQFYIIKLFNFFKFLLLPLIIRIKNSKNNFYFLAWGLSPFCIPRCWQFSNYRLDHVVVHFASWPCTLKLVSMLIHDSYTWFLFYSYHLFWLHLIISFSLILIFDVSLFCVVSFSYSLLKLQFTLFSHFIFLSFLAKFNQANLLQKPKIKSVIDILLL